MAGVTLRNYQLDAIKRMKTGCILCGGVGSGKSLTSIAYYYVRNGGIIGTDIYEPMNDPPKDLYIITTARKRDTCEWDGELAPFLLSTHDDVNLYSNTSAVNAKSYADSAASSKNAAASSASNASASATNAKKSETAAANSASLAQAAYEEILGADVGKFGSQLANEHSVLQPIYDSSGQNICDSSGREIQGRIIFADESEVVSLRQQVSYLDTFIRSVISRLGYVTDHALLDSDYKGL